MMKLCTMTSRKKWYSNLQEVVSKRDGMAKFPSSVVEFSQNIIEEAVSGLEIIELEYCCRPRTTVLRDLLLATGNPTKCERYPKGLVSLAASLYHEASFDWVGLERGHRAGNLQCWPSRPDRKIGGRKAVAEHQSVRTGAGAQIRVPTSSRINILEIRGASGAPYAETVTR